MFKADRTSQAGVTWGRYRELEPECVSYKVMNSAESHGGLVVTNS